MKALIFAVCFIACSGAVWATGGAGSSSGRGGTPSISCYKEGKMIFSAMEIPKCLKAGGHYKVEKSYKAE